MPIREISLNEFNARGPLRGPDVGTLIQEQAWFASDDGPVIGVLTLDAVDKDWGYIVLGPDEHGDFRGIDLAVSLKSRGEAQDGLIAAMEAALSSGRQDFPQGD
jgi:hypothetical protein